MSTFNLRQQDNSCSAPAIRSDRIFSQSDLWYIRTREGDHIGPFRYKSEAETNLHQFMEHLRNKLR